MSDLVRADREIIDDMKKEVRKARAEVPETRVHKLIERLRFLKRSGPLIGNRTSNREHAEKIIVWIDEAQQLFPLYGENFPWDFLFGPPLEIHKNTEPLDSSQLDATAAAAAIEAMPKNPVLRHCCLAALLGEMRWRCKWIIDERVGARANYGHLQECAAIASRQLLESVGIPLRYSHAKSTYRETSSLFFEVMTGTQGVDLERACRAVAKRKFDEGP